jgi:hypothetical protein
MMSMRTHFKTDRTSFASSFLLLAVVTGALNIDLFGGDTASGHHDHKILYRIELVLNAEFHSIFPVLSVSKDLQGNGTAAGRSLPSHFYIPCSGAALCTVQNTGQVNTRPLYSSLNHTRAFNIPHQNSDEDEALILPVGAA